MTRMKNLDDVELCDDYLTAHLSQIGNESTRNNKKHWFSCNYKCFLPSDKNSKILEIGPGFGELASFLIEEHGYTNFIGIDLDREVVDFCNSLYPDKFFQVTSTQEFLKNEISQIDLVFMLHVLEHIPKEQTISFLSTIRNSLSENGFLIVEVPNMSNPIFGLNLRYADFTHEIGFTETSLKYVLSKAGFSEISLYANKTPSNSLPRIAQRIMQLIVNGIVGMSHKIYMPNQKWILSPSIYAVAYK
jgi:2-polyprenyl-3-methyl-5-hydroxy-6-metoxy-1,4-benzoquinol methylase